MLLSDLLATHNAVLVHIHYIQDNIPCVRLHQIDPHYPVISVIPMSTTPTREANNRPKYIDCKIFEDDKEIYINDGDLMNKIVILTKT